MPVSRNLSLPSSIERKFKKRPEELHDLKHCLSMPASSQNKNFNNNSDVGSETESLHDHLASPMQFHSSDKAEQTFQSETDGSVTHRTRSPVNRNTLSQPCLSESSNVRATSIFPHLFLGSQKDVADKEMLDENSITNVLNVSCACARPGHLDDDHFRRIAVKDNYQEKITPHLDEAVNFIEAARKNNERVLVHCLAGVSRSATVAIAYVMYYLRLNFDDAYRFVKDKRPTISPNFNFLGQLMEYEKILRDRGHMSKPRSNSGAQDNDHETHGCSDYETTKLESKTSTSRHEATQLTKPLSTDIKPCILTPTNFGATSFCRRRKGPALEKLSFSRKDTLLPVTGSADNKEYNRMATSGLTSPGGAGVVLDLHVSVPVSEPHSRRLGSDGVEDEGDDEAEEHCFKSSAYTAHKSNSLPRCRPGGGGIVRCHLYATPPLSDAYRNGNKLSLNFRSSTAPNTPSSLLRLGTSNEALHSPRRTGLSAHERLFPRDVEMRQEDQDDLPQDVSPPSPSRFHDSSLLNPSLEYEKRAVFPSTSQRNDKFVSRKTKSPKVMKKSFNLNLRSSYGYQAFRTSKSNNAYQTSMSVRNRTHDGLASKRETQEPVAVPMHCESPNADGISSLTLYSPVITNNDPMEVVGKSCLEWKQNSDKKCLNSLSSTYLSARGDVNCARRNQSANYSLVNKQAHGSNGKPFQLVSSSELKPNWRNRRRSSKPTEAVRVRDINDTGLEINTTAATKLQPSSPTVINHCNNNLGIISCS